VKLASRRDPARPDAGGSDLRYILRGWGTTARYCAVTLTTGVPSVVIIWLTSRR
jgi:hypothetical protein